MPIELLQVADNSLLNFELPSQQIALIRLTTINMFNR